MVKSGKVRVKWLKLVGKVDEFYGKVRLTAIVVSFM